MGTILAFLFVFSFFAILIYLIKGIFSKIKNGVSNGNFKKMGISALVMIVSMMVGVSMMPENEHTKSSKPIAQNIEEPKNVSEYKYGHAFLDDEASFKAWVDRHIGNIINEHGFADDGKISLFDTSDINTYINQQLELQGITDKEVLDYVGDRISEIVVSVNKDMKNLKKLLS